MTPKMTRLAFYLWLYLLPALVVLSQPHHWLGAVLTMGLAPGLWRSFRRSLRRGRGDTLEMMLFCCMTMLLSLVVAAVSAVLGWLSLPCWLLVAFEQAHRPERRGVRTSWQPLQRA